MVVVVVVVCGVVFGAADQQLGSIVGHGAWTATAAQVSAPWLILPFLVGSTQVRGRDAAVLGLVATLSALVGYFAMTYSPLEIHPWSLDRFVSGFVAVTTRGRYNPAYIAAGLITGPAFGVLGHRWRLHRWWVSAVIVSATLCLEPLARLASGQLSGPGTVWLAEAAHGVLVAGFFTVVLARRPRSADSG
jgi:hypothetical protein